MIRGNRGFGVRIDGSSILPVYNFMTDDPRLHGLYLDRRAWNWLKAFPSVTDKPDLRVHSLRMKEAGLFDGQRLTPLGMYWLGRIKDRNFNLHSLGVAFYVFDDPASVPRAYLEMLQLHRFEDSAEAFKDYCKERANPKYKHRKYSLPSEGGSETVHFPEEYSKTEEPEPEGTRYFYHGGSDSVFEVEPGESLDFLGTDDFDELDEGKYQSIKRRLAENEGVVNNDDLSFDDGDEWDIL